MRGAAADQGVHDVPTHEICTRNNLAMTNYFLQALRGSVSTTFGAQRTRTALDTSHVAHMGGDAFGWEESRSSPARPVDPRWAVGRIKLKVVAAAAGCTVARFRKEAKERPKSQLQRVLRISLRILSEKLPVDHHITSDRDHHRLCRGCSETLREVWLGHMLAELAATTAATDSFASDHQF